MFIEKSVNGLVASDIVDGVRVHKLYIGYTERQVRSAFKKHVKAVAKK